MGIVQGGRPAPEQVVQHPTRVRYFAPDDGRRAGPLTLTATAGAHPLQRGRRGRGVVRFKVEMEVFALI